MKLVKRNFSNENWKDMFPKENRHFETGDGILYCGNCLLVMDKFFNNSIDEIVTDPPYMINYKTNMRDKTHPFASPIDNDNNPELIEMLIPTLYKKLKDNRAMYMFGSWKTQELFAPVIEKYFNLKNIIIWVKNNWTAGDLKAQYGQQYEIIFYANKGRAFLKEKRYPDVWTFDRVAGKQQVHQNQKPVALLGRMLSNSSEPNDIVLDPFIGSGSTAIACGKTGRRWIGIESNEWYCEIAKNRIRKEIAQQNLL